MKVYDGAGLIADKSDAMVVPVRIDGLEETPFSRLSRAQVRRRWFPKVTVTVLEPVKLTVDPALKGKHAAHGGGRGALRDHVRTSSSAPRRPTAPCSRRVIEAAEIHGMGRVAVEDPVDRHAHLPSCCSARACSAAS